MKNRSQFTPIIKTILFCGKQGLALSGHRENTNSLGADDELNDGNFRALLRFRIDSGDVTLEEHLRSGPKNATYTSATVQNEIIDAIGKIIRSKIVAEVNAPKFFSILADETRDISRQDQLTICLRYVVSSEGQQILKESFLSFCVATAKTDAGLAESILQILRNEGLDIRNLRGQGYDGASAMSGTYRGVQAELK